MYVCIFRLLASNNSSTILSTVTTIDILLIKKEYNCYSCGSNCLSLCFCILFRVLLLYLSRSDYDKNVIPVTYS